MYESIKQYLRRIGSKGGKALAGNPQAKAKAAAKAIAGTPKAKTRAAKAAKSAMGQAKTEKTKPKMRLTKELLKSGPGKLLIAGIDARTTLQQLKKECSRIGANLNLEKWHITAPEGHVFNATECHYIVFERWKEDRSPRWGKAAKGWNKTERKAAYQDAFERLKLGISPDPEPS